MKTEFQIAHDLWMLAEWDDGERSIEPVFAVVRGDEGFVYLNALGLAIGFQPGGTDHIALYDAARNVLSDVAAYRTDWPLDRPQCAEWMLDLPTIKRMMAAFKPNERA